MDQWLHTPCKKNWEVARLTNMTACICYQVALEAIRRWVVSRVLVVLCFPLLNAPNQSTLNCIWNSLLSNRNQWAIYGISTRFDLLGRCIMRCLQTQTLLKKRKSSEKSIRLKKARTIVSRLDRIQLTTFPKSDQGLRPLMPCTEIGEICSNFARSVSQLWGLRPSCGHICEDISAIIPSVD